MNNRGSGFFLFLAEIFLPADGHIGNEHHAGMPLEERTKPCENGLNFFFRARPS